MNITTSFHRVYSLFFFFRCDSTPSFVSYPFASSTETESALCLLFVLFALLPPAYGVACTYVVSLQ